MASPKYPHLASLFSDYISATTVWIIMIFIALWKIVNQQLLKLGAYDLQLQRLVSFNNETLKFNVMPLIIQHDFDNLLTFFICSVSWYVEVQ